MSSSLIRRLAKDEEAANAVEYGLITAVIAVALIAALVAFKDQISGMFNRAGSDIQSSS
ncbi:MAG: Flp family type IVb pilin [Deltaproteobacteria bacterium]|jgi:pilus assembly protein Flp/PilA|nr:Flp family type IVb pilin [Deltaproteobacteria bacterium]